MGKKGNQPNKTTLSTVNVIGDDKLILGCRQAIAQLRQTEIPSSKATRLTAQRGAQAAPKRTGALAKSISSNAQGIAYSPLVYAPVIHWGWPARHIEPNQFLLDSARQSEPQWLVFFKDFTDDAVEKMS